MTGKIKWRKIDEQKIRNVVRQFNAKLRRVERTDPHLAPYQPQYLNANSIIKELKQGTRQDYNKLLNRYQRYLREGGERIGETKAGVRRSRWEIREAKLDIATINARRRAELKRHPPSTEKGTMGTVASQNLKPRKDTTEEIPPNRWNDFVASLERQILMSGGRAKAEQYKANYLKALRNTQFGDTLFYSLIERMDAADVVAGYNENERLAFDIPYGHEEYSLLAAELAQSWYDIFKQKGYRLSKEEEEVFQNQQALFELFANS